jgi:hypothetical protein
MAVAPHKCEPDGEVSVVFQFTFRWIADLSVIFSNLTTQVRSIAGVTTAVRLSSPLRV